MLEIFLKVVCAASGLTAKWQAYVFLRLLPLGSHYLPVIYTSAAVYLTTWLLAYFRGSRNARISSTSLHMRCIVLICGIPDHRYPYLTWLGVGLTLLAPLFSADFVYRAHYLHPAIDLSFARLGWTGHDTASLLIRLPEAKFYNLTYYPSTSKHDQSRLVQLSSLTPATDFTLPIILDGLRPDTEYNYYINAEISGTFTTRRNATDLEAFTILSSSCLKPGWPYSPLAHPLEVKGFSEVDHYVRTMDRLPEAMLFLGDFIYSDLPYPVSEYTNTYYRQLYRQVYSSPSWTPLLRSIPWLHMFDDHEIINDFAPDSPHNHAMFKSAMEPYVSYQQTVNPLPLSSEQPTYFSFEIGAVSFFVLDNRSYRSTPPHRPGKNSTAGHGERTMLGELQLMAVKRWVEMQGRKEGRLLVLVSGVPVTRNWSEGKDELDSWAGYLDEREIILEELWSVGGAVIISGDRHEHATTLLPPPAFSIIPATSAVIEFSTSPLSFFHQPWTREYLPHLPTDVPLHHQWKGDTRFGVFDFDTSGLHPIVNFKLLVDGEEEWRYAWTKGAQIKANGQ
ncbi:uncharacterized protein IL334_003751 [Kwoniella shivajii]|uniref:PhoD-like phosphatase metallophosphatase domain-containing protein n=1 Tax=Kwoniella shivajii TaxID=564305 RepID=A0ABZ1CYF7_9TREE|nr:hypothetical protein IL334_003751 [Kwoniella shivajii]